VNESGAIARLSPWSGVESLRAMAFAGASAVIVSGAWLGAEREPSLRAQIPWVVVATAGFVVGSFGAVSWLLRARVAILTRRDELFAFAMYPDAAVAATKPGAVVVGPRPGKYHRPACPLAVGRGWPSVAVPQAVGERREPCGVCAP
jgi:hypothetical protein